MPTLIAIIISYLIGSIPFGYLVGRLWKGIDIRELGSGNIGTTNVWRNLGPVAGIISLLGDAGKGALAVLIAKQLGGPSTVLLASLAVLAGHSYPVFLKFKGGKIVATGLGVLLSIAPLVALIAAIVWLLFVGISRYVSLGSIAAAVCVPVSMLILVDKWQVILFGFIISFFAIYKHRDNIKRLLAGTEYKIGQKKM
ncbi:glycerol-3-phosphate 1-O-acyltransferase PlsY [Desulfolucanica intricata]|uniref:glycerol-3-phosphate 1-O-acyltransferase PlsY n=1 Tax=Desulfolucanica intricata TaxID=1285191 RepID=UPI000ADE84F8|nr:glycerol-3-phosphate 1-O-acyltransferase PlsY [Desulfolucanica intricata]